MSGTWVVGRPSAAEPCLLFYIMVDSVADMMDSVVAHGGVVVQPIGADAPYVLADSTPASLRAKWSGRLITVTHWALHSPQVTARLVAPGQVSRIGPFARISVETVDAGVSRFDRLPMRYRKSTTYYLMEQDGAWAILAIVEVGRND